MKLWAVLGIILVFFTVQVFGGETEGEIVTHKGLTGDFRLEKDTYVVAEPIIAIFEVKNNGEESCTFRVGGNYRGWPAYDRNFSVTIKNDQGRDFAYPPTGTSGGIGTTITLEPSGEKYRKYVLISSRAHILPPGNYSIEISRALETRVFVRQVSEIDQKKNKLGTFNGKMHFAIEPYDYEKLKNILSESYGLNESKDHNGFKMFSSKPTVLALSDISYKFDMGFSQGTSELQQKVISHLLKEWDDSYFLDESIKSNRNWLTDSAPEVYELTFRITNNSNNNLSSGVFKSTIYIDGEQLQDWKNILHKELMNGNVDILKPGKSLEFTHCFNKYVKEHGEHEIKWGINNVIREKRVNVRGK